MSSPDYVLQVLKVERLHLQISMEIARQSRRSNSKQSFRLKEVQALIRDHEEKAARALQ